MSVMLYKKTGDKVVSKVFDDDLDLSALEVDGWRDNPSDAAKPKAKPKKAKAHGMD